MFNYVIYFKNGENVWIQGNRFGEEQEGILIIYGDLGFGEQSPIAEFVYANIAGWRREIHPNTSITPPAAQE